jgi:hypothetical protein
MLIYSNSEDLTEGIYGQCITWLLEVLYYMEKNNKINNNEINFDINTLNNGNLIPTFIKPKKTYKIDNPIKINLRNYKIENNICGFNIHNNSFIKANEIFNKYFIFNDFILKQISYLNIPNESLGIHYRGTDKNYDNSQANPITQDEMLLIIEDYFKNNTVDKIYCCSDEQSFIDKIKIQYPHKTIEYKQLRSNNSDNYGFFRIGQNHQDKDNLTYASIIDMIALSKCRTIIKTSSALSSFSKIINPVIKLYSVCAMKQNWFPAAVAEYYKTDSPIINNILKRTMNGDVYNK